MNKKLWFLTKISLNKKIKTKWFLIANIFFFLIIVGVMNIDKIIKFFGGEFNEQKEILVIDNAGVYDEFKTNYNIANRYLTGILDEDETKIELYQDDYTKAYEEITGKNSKIVLIIDSDNDNYLKAKIVSNEAISSITNSVINSVLNGIRSGIVLKEYNITEEEYQKIETPVNIEREVIKDTNTEDDMIVAVIMEFITLPLFMLIMFLIQMIGTEVNEEKTTKSMEIIISNVSPKTHFLSKIISANAFIFIQSALLIAFILVGAGVRLYITNGDILNGLDSGEVATLASSIPIDKILETLSVMLPILLIMLVLTFFAYSLLAGILASMTTNSEDYQQLQTPIIITSLAGFYLSMVSGVFKGSLFIKIMSYIPLVSSLLAPTLYVLGEVSLIDICISFALLIGLIFILIKYGLRVYKVGILNYSSTGLWKKMAQAIKGNTKD